MPGDLLGFVLYDARCDVFDYIEMFYNTKRRHGFNDLLSPVEYENKITERLISV